MSKATKQSIFILIVLLLAALGYAGYLEFVEKPRLESEKQSLAKNLEETETREQKALHDIKQLKDDLNKANTLKQDLEKQIQSAKAKADEMMAKLDELGKDRDGLQARIDEVSQERDKLKEDVNKSKGEFQQKIADLEKELSDALAAKGNSLSGQEETPSSLSSEEPIDMSSVPQSSDQYWATILKSKAELEVKLEQIRAELSEKSIEVLNLKQKNADLQIELDGLKHDKDSMQQEITYNGELVNNLSLELARTKNDKKFMADRVAKLNEENQQIRGQLRQLVSSKGSLEKSIVKLTHDKNKIQQELGNSESLIQSKIDEIWDIKDSIDQSFKSTAQTRVKDDEIELSPIHVNSAGASAVSFDPGSAEPGFAGRIVSINEENNFVIVDIGASKGLQVGDMLSVYRDSKYIARLEVIQVRGDISAADVKDQWSRIVVGDIIR